MLYSVRHVAHVGGACRREWIDNAFLDANALEQVIHLYLIESDAENVTESLWKPKIISDKLIKNMTFNQHTYKSTH